MEKLSKGFRLRTPFRYIINTALTVVLWAVLTAIISGAGMKGEYYRGILITVGINIILATSLNIVCGYLGQLPLGHAGFMAVGAYTGALFWKATASWPAGLSSHWATASAASVLTFFEYSSATIMTVEGISTTPSSG